MVDFLNSILLILGIINSSCDLYKKCKKKKSIKNKKNKDKKKKHSIKGRSKAR